MRDAIERTTKNVHDGRWRILVKRQGALWDDGVKAGNVLREVSLGEPDDDEDGDTAIVPNGGRLIPVRGEYVAGKWGRFLRAPDLYFEIMERYSSGFVPLGQLVEIRRGITSGCDAFFMPTDVTALLLAEHADEKEFRKAVGIARKDVVAGTLRIIRDGAGTYHAIEPAFIRPEIHSLMKVDRPIVRAKDFDRVVVLIKPPLSAIKGTHAYRYIKYGEQATYASNKSKAVPVPQRSSCAARSPWYDLTKLVDPGFALWPKSQQYRHIIPGNPGKIVCNCNLYDFGARELSRQEQQILVAVANSTMIGLFKTFYGRYAGTEGNLKTEIVDVNLIEIPDPRGASKQVAQRMAKAMKSICARRVGGLVEDALKECHSYDRALELASRRITLPEELRREDRRELDDAVFELLGVDDPKERSALVDRLYEETTLHFRNVRVTEIQKMEDRRTGGNTRFAAADHAADVWDALELTDLTPLVEWVAAHATGDCELINIPAERPVHLAQGAMFDNETVYFGKARREYMVCQCPGEAVLIARMATLGVTGEVSVPKSNHAAIKLLDRLNVRHDKAAIRMRELAASRSSDSDTQDQVFKLLERWYVLGKPASIGRDGDLRQSDSR